MKIYSILLAVSLAAIVGCTTFFDPRPPLMDDDPFTKFFPTVVTTTIDDDPFAGIFPMVVATNATDFNSITNSVQGE